MNESSSHYGTARKMKGHDTVLVDMTRRITSNSIMTGTSTVRDSTSSNNKMNSNKGCGGGRVAAVVVAVVVEVVVAAAAAAVVA